MKKTLLSILTVAFILTFVSCNKKDDLVVPPTGVSASPDSYQPMTAGSVWTYNIDVGGSTDVLTLKMTGKSMMADGRRYYEATTSLGAGGGDQISYLHQTGTLYGMRGQAPQSQTVLDLDYLDVSKPVNGTWELSFNPAGTMNGIAGKTKYKLVEKDITKVVNGKTFKNVMHTKIELQYDLGFGNGPETMTDYDYYCAKGVGMIELDTYFLGVLAIKETIATYNVK